MTETLLSITGSSVTPYSARGLKQTLEPIAAATNQRRTVDGELVSISLARFAKYRSTISCSDVNAPVLDGIWPGQQVTIDCVCELSYLTSGGSPNRTVVPNSSRTEGSFTFYRPRLIMLVSRFNIDTDEYGAVVGWQLELEEK